MNPVLRRLRDSAFGFAKNWIGVEESVNLHEEHAAEMLEKGRPESAERAEGIADRERELADLERTRADDQRRRGEAEERNAQSEERSTPK